MGVRRDRLLTMRVPLAAQRYPDAARRTAFFRGLLDRVGALPGVQAVGAEHGAAPALELERAGGGRGRDRRGCAAGRAAPGQRRLHEGPGDPARRRPALRDGRGGAPAAARPRQPGLREAIPGRRRGRRPRGAGAATPVRAFPRAGSFLRDRRRGQGHAEQRAHRRGRAGDVRAAHADRAGGPAGGPGQRRSRIAGGRRARPGPRPRPRAAGHGRPDHGGAAGQRRVRRTAIQPGVVRRLRGPRALPRRHRGLRRDLARGVTADAGDRRAPRAGSQRAPDRRHGRGDRAEARRPGRPPGARGQRGRRACARGSSSGASLPSIRCRSRPSPPCWSSWGSRPACAPRCARRGWIPSRALRYP